MVLRPGQTLIEVLLALAIILVGMMSLVSTLINAKITADASVDSAIAVQLAREPIEAARFIRDSNWLKRENGFGTSYNEGLVRDNFVDPNDYTATYTWDPPLSDPAFAVQFNFDPDSSTDALTVIYRDPGNLYRHTPAGFPPPGFAATIYSRYVTLFPICSSDGGVTEQFITADGQDCVATYGSPEIGLQVNSTVTWSNRGTDHAVTLEERLYDWRYAQP